VFLRTYIHTYNALVVSLYRYVANGMGSFSYDVVYHTMQIIRFTLHFLFDVMYHNVHGLFRSKLLVRLV